MTEATYSLRKAVEADQALIQGWVRDSGINPLGLDWKRFTMAEAPGGEPIGCVQLKPHRDGSVELASLVVAEAWRGRGVARVLIESAIADHDGPLYLMCRSELGPLYEKFGFRTLAADEMPRYFRLMNWLVSIYNLFRGREQYVLIMRHG